MTRAPNFALGVFLSLLASLLYACYSAGIKFVGEEGANSVEMIFFTYLIGWLYLLPGAFRKGVKYLKTKRIRMHFLRALFGVSFVFSLIYSIQFIPLVDAVMLNNTAPLFMPIIVQFWFGVRQKSQIWFCLVIGLLGVMLVLKPDQVSFSIGTLTALLSGILMAFAWASIRKLTVTEPSYRVNCYYFSFATLLTAVPYFLFFSPISLSVLVEMLGCGILFLSTALLITYASVHVSMVLISILFYAVIVFSGFFNWLFWGQIPDGWTLLGIVLIIAGGIASILVEKRKYKNKSLG